MREGSGFDELLSPQHPMTAGQMHLIDTRPTAECGLEC